MPVTWKSDKHAKTAQKILGKLDGVLKANPNGSVSIGIEGEFQYGVNIVARSARFSSRIRDSQRVAIARRAILDATRAGNLSSQGVLENLRRGQGIYLGEPKRRYVLLSNLSITYQDDLQTVRPYGATITFSRFKPKAFKAPEQLGREMRAVEPDTRLSTTVRVAIRDRDPHSAAETAFERLDFMRSIWNLYYNYRSRRILLGGGRGRPFNDIISGPYYTLHNPDGSPVKGSFWLNPSYPDYSYRKSIGNDYAELRKFESFIRDGLRKSSFEDRLVSFLIRYVRALDEKDLTATFLRLWALLEDVTASGAGNYDTLVDRTLFLVNDVEYHSVVLGHLREWRNNIVHESHELADVDPIINDLRHYVERLLLFLIRHVKEFKSLDDYGVFLSLPRDTQLLKHRIKLHDLASRL